jgi:hypothetical protein
MTDKKVESAEVKTTAVKARSTVRKFTRKVVDSKTEGSSPVAADQGETRRFHDKKSYANSPKDFQAVRDAIEKKINDFFEANKESGLRKLVSASKLMEAGAHIGMPAKF